MKDNNGIPTNKEMIATDYWMRLSPLKRLEIIQKVDFKGYKADYKKFRMIIDYVVNNLIEYSVNGNILTGIAK